MCSMGSLGICQAFSDWTMISKQYLPTVGSYIKHQDVFLNSSRSDPWYNELSYPSRYAILLSWLSVYSFPSPGGVFSISALAVPPILLAPSPLVAQQWKRLFDIGKAAAPALAATSALSFSFLALKWYGTLNQPRAEIYGLSALITVSIIPYTFVFMRTVNKELLSNAKQANALKKADALSEGSMEGKESSKQLLDLWATHNAIRGLFPLAASVLALWTTVGS